jgi:hypothetical protein
MTYFRNMNFKPTSKFQRKHPQDYRSKLEIIKGLQGLDERARKIRPIRDTWWIVTSESSSSKVYMLHIHMKFFTVDVGHTHERGRIECECPSFTYCKYKPRHCKHTVELARQFFGLNSFQYKVLVKSQQEKIHDEDKWCAENYKVFEAMLDKTTKKKKYNTHAEKIRLEQREIGRRQRLRSIQK